MTTVERDVDVMGELGLHARPAAAFAEAAGRFTSRVTVGRGEREVDASSVLLVLTLDVRRGDRVHLRAVGPDAAEAVDALASMIGAP